MSNQSNQHGRAYEYICLMILKDEISKIRKAVIEENSSFFVSKKAWDESLDTFKKTLEISAKSAVQTIFDLEPLN